MNLYKLNPFIKNWVKKIAKAKLLEYLMSHKILKHSGSHKGQTRLNHFKQCYCYYY